MWIINKKTVMVLVLSIPLLCCLHTTVVAGTSKDERCIEVQKVENNNDGHFLKPAAWDKIDEQGNFATVPSNKPAREQTTFKIAYDDNYLYLRVICAQDHVKDHVAAYPVGSKHDSPVFCDDSLEVFLDTLHDHENYYYFVCNIDSVRFDAKYAGANVNSSWNGRWFAQTMVLDDKWVADISIPFSTLFIRPQQGAVWGFNIARTNKLREFSSWSPGLEMFHTPRKFGYLVWGLPSSKSK
jgi:hypothetical protein